MKKVLVIDNSRYVTGAIKSIAAFAEELKDSFDFYWAIDDQFPEEALFRVLGAQPIKRMKFVEISRALSSFISYLPYLLRNSIILNKFVRSNEISIVHVNDCYNMTGVVLKLMNRRLRVVYHVRLLRSSHIRSLYSFFVWMIGLLADALVCCSEAVGRDVGTTKISKHIIYDSLPIDKGFVRPLKSSANVESLVYIANVMQGKGQDIAVRALSLIHEEFPELKKLYFVGSLEFDENAREYKGFLDGLIGSLGLTENVVFNGFAADVDKELDRADIALCFSASESFSMTCLEALRRGVPLIATDCGGPAEILEDMKSGILIPPGDVAAAADALRRLIRSAALRRSLQENGPKRVAKKFDVAVNCRLLERVYEPTSAVRAEI